MMKTLSSFNFGESFLKWIKLFYNDVNSCVYNNGHMSSFFKVERGVRQGCPLSPYLFISAIEILSHIINTDNNIKGITLINNEVKTTMFADDATFITDGTKTLIENVIKDIDYFSLLLGLNLNKTKTTIMRCGSLKNTNFMCCQDHNFKWNSEKASTLGMTFSNNANDIEENNLTPKLNQYLQCLQHWKKHNLTLFGKICVLKTYALPKLTYPLTILENPNSIIMKILKDSMFKVLWDGKPDKISRKVIVQNYSNGGLKMIEIESYINSLKAKWIKRILDNQNNGQWKDLYIYELNKLGGESIFKANIKHTDVKQLNIKSKFLTDIIEAWAKFNYKEFNVEK